MIIDNEELYEKEKPLPLDDIRYLIVILREVNVFSFHFTKRGMFNLTSDICYSPF